MTLKGLTLVWIAITSWLSIEYLAANGYFRFTGLMLDIQCFLFDSCRRFDPRPGKPVSYFLGWLGFGVMALTNLYIIRKRVHSLQKLGNLQAWLDWHIFFGLMGPTLIVFHCNFKVGGLVAISFWSMVVSFVSGIIGRYFYIQLLQRKTGLRSTLDAFEQGFHNYVRISSRGIGEQDMERAKAIALYQATGGVMGESLRQMGLVEFIFRSFSGDINLMFRLPATPWGGSRPIRKKLRDWAFIKRRLIFMHYYQLLFGYWRTFHTPFAIFMYVVAIIHIVSSLIFKVN
ncbi:hypothetical protein [Pseudobacteriovorax antillogorgiicola]|uniref:Uncharacterized protein n=1 Tax=Pseudobacteriovorax antillogorgiicola TaxID=1513793 RepID=A0A1Y6BYM4_9BACT|nr:hypothetical protein [Pseudobacteriovorax antillogorgiicola]TCS51265.1 hypothetical protein EDD56_111150 [Pseudobacteriovorax antillogorgiicola]SMF36406.1 hypothetical protein SAMN06296036_11128 [Pseudobacteriovorax antillogorgiicola]